MSSGNGAAPLRRKVIITGISGRLGRLLARRLHRDERYHVVGIDRRPFPGRPRDIEHHQVDLRSRKARDIFRAGDVGALIHMGVMHGPRATTAELYSWNIGGTMKLLDYCLQFEVPKVIVLSSANVYGPRPENAQFLTEEAPLLAAQAFPKMRDLVEIDHLASSFFWKARDVETVILRPVHILGQVKNAPSNYLRLETVPTLLGFDPMVQMIHEQDVAEAIVCALKPGARGIYNITGPGEVPLSVALQELGRRTVPVPHPMAKPLWQLAFRLGLSTFPAAEFDFIRYVCMVDGSRAARELEYRPRHSLRDTIRAVESADPG
ncbi:MAG TPA: NAD-dependent epimerase/dehydratase family protein [Kofleriaceae bacterium]|nr:NAD-dependent epimerase/dehydratase family protein [Kofleriaceae bacterium]